MKVTIYEGTPDEIARILPSIQPAPSPGRDAGSGGAAVAVAVTGEKRYVNVEEARLVLSRRPLSAEQLIVFRTLYEAHPHSVLATELQDKTHYTPAQFAGLMGALGRRLTHTEGYKEGTWLFDVAWDINEGCCRYCLPEGVRSALELEKLV
ncbi:MAG: hypothetical protein WDM91_15785 [Rhizomicrobium sp.]